LYSASLSIPPFVNPLALIAIMAAFILNPTKTFRHEARFWALKVLVSHVCLINLQVLRIH
jgi:putative flippase GtrA